MDAKRFDPARRTALAGCVGGAALALLGRPAWAQAWPAKPLRLLLGYTPGGAADVTAREVATPLGKVLGQPLVIDYKPGASGTIAGAEVARAAPDGYTLGLLDNAPLTIVPALRNAGYDPLAAFTPIAMVSQLPQLLVAPPSAGVNSVRELIDAMRRLTPSATAPFIASGRLKALGVSSLARIASLPNVPTIAESGVPDFDAPGWFALMGPAGMPEPVVAALRKAVAETLATPAMATRLEALGQTVAPARTEMRQTIAAELATWKKLIAERKLAIDG